jgi:hypothetical protein
MQKSIRNIRGKFLRAKEISFITNATPGHRIQPHQYYADRVGRIILYPHEHTTTMGNRKARIDRRGRELDGIVHHLERPERDGRDIYKQY